MTEGKPLRVRDPHAWHDESHIPHGVDLTVCEGETVTILGRNRMGKTTLRSIMGILRKRSGAVEFAGKALTRLPLHYNAPPGSAMPRRSGASSERSASRKTCRRHQSFPPHGMLLDEPTEGLAPVIVQRIGKALQTLKQRGMTSCRWNRTSALPARSPIDFSSWITV